MIALSFLLVIGGILLAEGLLDCYNFSIPEDEHIELNKIMRTSLLHLRC